MVGLLTLWGNAFRRKSDVVGSRREVFPSGRRRERVVWPSSGRSFPIIVYFFSTSAPLMPVLAAGRSRAISDRMSANICRETATSAIWKLDVSAVTDDLRADLDQLFAQAGHRPGLSTVLGSASVRMKFPEIIGQCVEWACRKLWRRPHDGLCRPRFYALLAAGSPKQTDNSWFCSHTVQAPAKSKPFRSHSIASNPRIVRRAVWKD